MMVTRLKTMQLKTMQLTTTPLKTGPQLSGTVWQAAPALPATRWASVVRAAYGVALLCAPGPMVQLLTDVPASSRVRGVARVLGVRHLAQAAVCGLVPARGVIQAGAAADGLHSASMLALAGVEPRLRRALLADAAVAAAFAAAGEAALRR
jgi:hypothetical protein